MCEVGNEKNLYRGIALTAVIFLQDISVMMIR